CAALSCSSRCQQWSNTDVRQAPRVFDAAWQASRLALGRQGPKAARGMARVMPYRQPKACTVESVRVKARWSSLDLKERLDPRRSCLAWSVYYDLHIVMYSRHSSN